MKNIYISRRSFLHGAGVTMALPFLEAMLPSYALAQATGTGGMPVRFIGIYFANGVLWEQGAAPGSTYNKWQCTGSATNWTLSQAMSPLQNVKQHINVLHGVMNDSVQHAYSNFAASSGHYAASTSFLAGQPYNWNTRKTNVGLLRPGASLDWMYGNTTANRIKVFNANNFPRSTNPGDNNGLTDLLGTISFQNQTTQANRIPTSRQAFDALFKGFVPPTNGGGGAPTPTPVPNKTNQYRQSALDAVLESGKRLKNRLGAADRQRLDLYLTQVEAIERGIANEESMMPTPTPRPSSGQSCSVPPAANYAENEPTNGALIHQRSQNLLDLAVLAFKCDITRSAGIMLEMEHNEFNLIYRQGVATQQYTHHAASHYKEAGSPTQRAAVMTEFHRWQTGMLARLVSRLAAESEGGVPMIDNTLVVFGTGLGNSHNHSVDNMGLILAGKAGGTIQTGRLLNFNRVKHSNLLLTLAQRLKIPVNSMGLSNGTVNL